MVLVLTIVFAISIATHFRVPLLPAIGAELTMSPRDLGLVTGAFALGRLATDIPAGRFVDRVPTLRALATAGGVMSLGSVLLATAPSGRVAIGAALVLGVASAISHTAGMTHFSASAPRYQRGKAMAAFSAAMLGGQALGPTAAGLLGDLGGWRVAIGFAAGVGGLVAVVGGLRSFAPPVSSNDPSYFPTPDRALSGKIEVAGVGHQGQRWLLYLAGFANFLMLGSMPQTLLPIIGADQHGLVVSTIGIALGLGGICRLLGAVLGGWVADRYSRKAALVPGMGLSSFGVCILAFDLGVAGWVAAIIILSLGSYGISVAATMLADRSPESKLGQPFGIFRFIGDLGLISGPVVATILYEAVGIRTPVVLVAGILVATTLICAFKLKETHLPGGTSR